MFQAKQKNNNGGGFFAGLTKKQQKQVNETITAAKGDPDKPESVQDSIPYLAMYPDGVCKVTERLYSKTIEFSDVNYLLAGKEEQTAIFEGICDLWVARVLLK